MKQTLYINRPLLNAEEVIEWAKSQGFTTTLLPDDMHVTIAYSKAPVEWSLIKEPSSRLTKMESNDREVQPLGDEGALVLKFNSSELQRRWKRIMDAGASWDFPQYNTHVTFTYNGNDVDLSTVKPYEGKLMFGPEVYKELDPNWNKKIKEE